MCTWTTKDKRKMKIHTMSTEHIKNARNMLLRKGCVSQDTCSFYISYPAPQGDIAQMMVEQEIREVMDSPVHPAIDKFEEELKKRRVKVR